MWSMVAQRLTQITLLAATSDQLWQRVEAARSAVLQEHIQSLFGSMPRRVAAVSVFFTPKSLHIPQHANTCGIQPLVLYGDKDITEIENRPIGTKNVGLSAIPINLLSILNFSKLNPKNLVRSIKHGGGSVLASRVRGFYANQSQRTKQFFESGENLLSKTQCLKYRIQHQYSQNKSQKVLASSTGLRHNYRCLKYTYVKDYSQAIARSATELRPLPAKIVLIRLNIHSNKAWMIDEVMLLRHIKSVVEAEERRCPSLSAIYVQWFPNGERSKERVGQGNSGTSSESEFEKGRDIKLKE
ncbi:hypothetical protein TNCV_3467501 [Trichonephila clavipes]|nr:hypothetical protein TNCV_3467501 [Trichonephila clavipes]